MAILGRTDHAYAAPDGSKSGLIPHEYSTEIIQSAREQSLALSTFRNIPMSTSVRHMPVLDALPTAYWVNGEPGTDGTGGEKATTDQIWKGVVLTAEELAAIVVIPEAMLEDSSIDLWGQITPRLGEAIGKALDLAVFAGTNKPTSWPAAIVPGALAASQQVNTGGAATPADLADYDAAFTFLEEDGHSAERIYANQAQKGVYRTLNTSTGALIYLSDVRDDGRVDSLYSVPITYDRMGVMGATTEAIVGDPSFALLGTRTDIEYKVLTEATIDISAALDGTAMVNLAQQDAVGLRVRARFGYAVANPVTHLQTTEADRYPFATIVRSV
jgi:HK97 family phage major capsid protein